MTNLFPIQKQQEHPIFGRFNARYGDALVNYCPLLSKFQINILTVEEYKALPDGTPLIDDIEKEAFACFIQKEGETADTTNAGIIFNQSQIDFFDFTEPEQHACVAHEIGHILYFFLDNKSDYSDPYGEEIYSDSIATRLDLSSNLLSSIEKLGASGLFPDSISRFGKRVMSLQSISYEMEDNYFI